MKSERSSLQAAWNLKLDQKIEECQSACSALCKSVGASADLHVLQASLFRTQGDVDQAVAELNRAHELFQKQSESDSSEYFFEKGLLHFIQGDFSLAMENFLSASQSRSERFIPKCFSLTNALLCMENLGLPYESTLIALRAELQGSSESASVVAQIAAFEMRQKFRAGDLDSIPCASSATSMDPEKIDQTSYFRFWISQLPYHTGFRPMSQKEMETFLLASRFFHARPYRLRTFQGVSHPEDSKIAKPSEMIDRLYLWVWKWLVNPKSFPVSRVLSLLGQIKVRDVAHRLTVEDSQLLRNSLLWLGLFDSQSFHRVEKLLKWVQKSDMTDYPVFGFEALALGYFRALQLKDRSLASVRLAQLEEHPFWGNPRFLFRQVIEALKGDTESAPNTLRPLVAHLKIFLETDEGPKAPKNSQTPVIMVDLARQSVQLSHEEVYVSAPITAALALFSSQATVSLQALTSACFGISRYDSLIHQIKVLNLFARMRKMFQGRLDFRVKSGFAVVTGSWDGIQIKKSEVLISESLRDQAEWKEFLLSITETESAKKDRVLRSLKRLTPRLALKATQALSRRELEALTGKSRASANRMLEQWTYEGLLIREGSARATRYILTDKLQKILNKGVAA